MSAAKSRKLLIAAAWASATIVLPLYAVKVWLKTDYTDFDVYYRAATRARAGLWDEIYSLKDGASPFRYAPTTLPFFWPFAAAFARCRADALVRLPVPVVSLRFLLIYAALRRMRSRSAGLAAALSALFVLRFCLDCFTIGQSSSLLFLAFTASFYFWTLRRPGAAGAFLLVPSVFKIGPAFLYALLCKGRPWERRAMILTPILWLGGALAVSTLWIGLQARSRGFWELNHRLWAGWLEMVSKDSQYYDASHYGSQSINSALLRAANSGWISRALASDLRLGAGAAICGGILLFWCLRRPRRTEGRALFFALGLFPYLWVMPETFKYSLTVLAIPVALLLNGALALNPLDVTQARRRRAVVLALGFGAATLSLAGKDIVGDPLFFGLPKASSPLLATFVAGLSGFRAAFRQSHPSRLSQELAQLFVHSNPGPWEREEPAADLQFSLLAPLPLDPGIGIDLELVKRVLTEHVAWLEKATAGSYEIWLEPYGGAISPEHPLHIELSRLSRAHPKIRLGSGGKSPARNLALRSAYLMSRGRTIGLLHLEQPCDPRFFEQALPLLEQGYALVRGNRRHPESRFRIPVRLLRLVYGRHRMGMGFNRLVRLWLPPIRTTDTHSGCLAMSRELARAAFALQSSTGFPLPGSSSRSWPGPMAAARRSCR